MGREYKCACLQYREFAKLSFSRTEISINDWENRADRARPFVIDSEMFCELFEGNCHTPSRNHALGIQMNMYLMKEKNL